MPLLEDDDDAADARSDEAWRIAREIVARTPPPDDWPPLPPIVGHLAQFLTETQRRDLSTDMRRALNETYFYGLILAHSSIDAALDLNGLRVLMRPLVEFWPDAAEWLLVSYESALMEHEGPSLHAMAARFRGLAVLCERMSIPR